MGFDYYQSVIKTVYQVFVCGGVCVCVWGVCGGVCGCVCVGGCVCELYAVFNYEDNNMTGDAKQRVKKLIASFLYQNLKKLENGLYISEHSVYIQ